MTGHSLGSGSPGLGAQSGDGGGLWRLAAGGALEVVLAESVGRKAERCHGNQPTPMGAHGGSLNKNSHLFQDAVSSPHLHLLESVGMCVCTFVCVRVR